tara:strand:+ start:2123 stop:2608 length:486 start_codon:yes stop_codon:yes gene_type:complete
MANIIDKIYDNTKDGVPNYSINLIDGTRLYCRGVVMNPMPNSGDAINYTVMNVKTSANGNQYTNVKDVQIADNNVQQNNAPQTLGNVVDNSGWNSPTIQALNSPQPPQQNNGFNKGDTQRMDIFVTGIVGRSMGSGHFSVEDIEKLTKNAVSAFNENLKKL